MYLLNDISTITDDSYIYVFTKRRATISSVSRSIVNRKQHVSRSVICNLQTNRKNFFISCIQKQTMIVN